MTLSLSDDSSASQANPFDIVVAHFNEDLKWLEPAAPNAIVYVKGIIPYTMYFHEAGTILADVEYTGKPPKEGHLYRETIDLPNIGRESHTFLHHIVSRYDTLADVTLFLQGSTDGPACHQAHTDLSIIQMIEKAVKTEVGKLTTFGSREENNLRLFWQWETSQWKADPYWKHWLEHQKGEVLDVDCSPGKFWFDTFGYDHPFHVTFAEGAIFAVHAKSIHARPREFYQRLLNKFVGTNHVNPAIGHFVEKFWGEILSCAVRE